MAKPVGSTSADVRPVDLGDLPNHIGYMARRAQMAIFSDFIHRLKQIDLRPAQYGVLMIIERNPGCKQSDIADALGIQKPNFGAMMNELIRRGLVLRVQARQDKRSYEISLTQDGADLLHRAKLQVAEHEAAIARRLGPDGRAQMIELLEKVHHGLVHPGEPDA